MTIHSFLFKEVKNILFSLRGPNIFGAFLLVVVGLSIFASSYFVPYHSLLPAWNYFDDSYIINPGGQNSFSTRLGIASIVEVMIVINGEGQVQFTAKNQEGQTIITEELDPGRYYFELPDSSTTYNLFFMNDGSYIQSVYWIVWVYYYKPTFQILGSIVVATAIIISIIQWSKEETKITALKEERIKPPKMELPIAETPRIEPPKKTEFEIDLIQRAKKVMRELNLDE